MSQQLILVDGTAYLFRSYFSTLSSNLSNESGFPTGAIFGVINSIKHLQRKYPNYKLIMIFDAKGSNFRHDMYSQYKENRKPADEALIMQIEPLYKIVLAMGFHFLCIEDVEADDVIATISRLAEERDFKAIIASSDKDLYQLVNENINQLDMKGKLYDTEKIEEKMGVKPHQIRDLLALTGDSTDNIPGVPGVGPKTAAKWLQLYGDIDGVKANADNIAGKIGEKLRSSFEVINLSYQLVGLKFDVDLPSDIFQEEPGEDKQELASLFTQYGFSSWLRQLGVINKEVPKQESSEMQIIDSEHKTASFNIKDYSQSLILKKIDF